MNKANLTHDMIVNTGLFSISVLSQDVPFEIFQHFGFQSGRDTDKFGGWAFAGRSENGTLHLTKFANAVIAGKVVSTQDWEPILCLWPTSLRRRFCPRRLP